MSNLVEHAKRELAIINEDKDVADAYLRIVEIFADMGHSGGSASVAIPTIAALLNFQNLAPLTDNPEEWFFHGEEMWGAPGGIWQNIRNSEAFSRDGGKTYYLLSEGGTNPVYNAGNAKMHTSRSWEGLKQVQAASDS